MNRPSWLARWTAPVALTAILVSPRVGADEDPALPRASADETPPLPGARADETPPPPRASVDQAPPSPRASADAPTWPRTSVDEGAWVTMTPYGFLNGEAEFVSADGGATPYRPRGRVSDGNSRFGLAGTIKLSTSVRAVWQIEGGLGSFDQGGVNDQGYPTTLVARNTFVGVLDRRFGRLIVGYNESAYRTLVGSAGEFGGNLGLTKTGLDVWNNTSAQMSGNPDSIFSRGEDRYKNSIHYDSPTLAGFNLAASYSFDEAITGGRLRQRYSVGIRYGWGPIMVGAGYDHHAHTGVNLDRLRAGTGFLVDGEEGVATNFYKALAVLHLPTHTSIAGGYEIARYGYSDFEPPSTTEYYPWVGTGIMQQSGALASVTQGLFHDHLVLMAEGGHLWGLGGAVVGQPEDYQAWQFSVGAKVMLGDRFSTYVYYTQIRNHVGQNVNLGEAPLYSNNLGSSAAYLAPGDCPRAAGIGTIARF